jgi:integrase
MHASRLPPSAFRRGLASNLNGLGVDVKTIQELLRHGSMDTNRDAKVWRRSCQWKSSMAAAFR